MYLKTKMEPVMPIYNHKEGKSIFRHFTGENVQSLSPTDLIRLTLNEGFDRVWAIHTKGRWKHHSTPEDAVLIQLLDLLHERGDLVEFTAEKESLEEKRPGIEVPGRFQ